MYIQIGCSGYYVECNGVRYCAKARDVGEGGAVSAEEEAANGGRTNAG